LFDRVSVFVGGFALEDVEDVCATLDVDDDADLAGLLVGLVDKSMITAREAVDGSVRYRLLETLREYAAERLVERGENAAVRQRHAEHFAALARAAGTGVQGPDEARWVARFEAAFDDLRAAHAWAVRHNHVSLALAIAADLQPFGRYNRGEVLRWAEVAIGMPGAEEHERYPGACAGAAHRSGLLGDLARAEELGRRSIELAAARGRRPPSTALYAVALRSFAEGGEDAVAEALRRRDLALSVGDDGGAATSQMYAALSTGYQGDTDTALEMAAEAQKLMEKTGKPGWPSGRAGMFYVYGEILQDVDPGRATRYLEDAIALARSVHADFTADISTTSLASLHGRHGSAPRALELFMEVVAERHRQGAWRQQWVTLRNVAELLGRLDLDAQAAVLLGAIDVASTAPRVFGAQAARLTELRHRLEERLGADGMRLATDHGAAMGDDAAVRYAQTVMRDAL
jgi:hypothetical protein